VLGADASAVVAMGSAVDNCAYLDRLRAGEVVGVGDRVIVAMGSEEDVTEY